MKVKVNENCIGCGNCVMMTDEKVFKFNDENLAEAIVDEVPKDMEETVKEAIDACPVDAIEEVKEEKE